MGLSPPPGSMGPSNNGLNHNHHMANHGNQSNVNLRLYATTNYPHQHQSRLYEYHTTTTNTSSTSLASASFATGFSLFHDRMPTRTRTPTTTLHELHQLPPAEQQQQQQPHQYQYQYQTRPQHQQQQQIIFEHCQQTPPTNQQHPIHRPMPLYPFQAPRSFREPYVLTHYNCVSGFVVLQFTRIICHLISAKWSNQILKWVFRYIVSKRSLALSAVYLSLG